MGGKNLLLAPSAVMKHVTELLGEAREHRSMQAVHTLGQGRAISGLFDAALNVQYLRS